MKPGNWWVELDDGTGAERGAEIDGAARLEVGECLPGKLYRRSWRVDRVAPERKYAHAVPHE